ncbi:unnamed protein product [Symbiodinium sp. CCMP2592]|nr:unnamed protein product [Symbiodinium sp. CCMP2592]
MARALRPGEGLVEIEDRDGRVWQVPINVAYWRSLSGDQSLYMFERQTILMVKLRNQIEAEGTEDRLAEGGGVLQCNVALGCECLPRPPDGLDGPVAEEGEKEDSQSQSSKKRKKKKKNKPQAEGEKKDDKPMAEGEPASGLHSMD